MYLLVYITNYMLLLNSPIIITYTGLHRGTVCLVLCVVLCGSLWFSVVLCGWLGSRVVCLCFAHNGLLTDGTRTSKVIHRNIQDYLHARIKEIFYKVKQL